MADQMQRVILWPQPDLTEEQVWTYFGLAVVRIRPAEVVWGYDISRGVVVPLWGRDKIEQDGPGDDLIIAYNSRLRTGEVRPGWIPNPLELEFVSAMFVKAKGGWEYQAGEEPLTFRIQVNGPTYTAVPGLQRVKDIEARN
jgi:hypothetical protein